MKLTIFGLTLSSSWGNGHATLWRGLISALSSFGHDVVFFERDVPYYAAHRDLSEFPRARLVLYGDWPAVRARAHREMAGSDVVIVTSYCQDVSKALEAARDCAPKASLVFYDLDTPVTLSRLQSGAVVDYVPADGLGQFDLVLSFTGGMALDYLGSRLGARRVATLYGHVDPAVHCPPDASHRPKYYDLSYLGTYAADRQSSVDQLFLAVARKCSAKRFLLGGSGYPGDFPWTDNIWFVRHVTPAEHSRFYGSSRLTLNVTRAEMAALGFCPSGRLFEAAACAMPILSDRWEGIDSFFTPGEEILLASTTEEAEGALGLSDRELARIAAAARERVLTEHTSAHRARELLGLLESVA